MKAGDFWGFSVCSGVWMRPRGSCCLMACAELSSYGVHISVQWIAKPLSGCTTYSLQRSPHGSCRSHPAKLRADKLNPALTSFPPILQGRSRAGAKRRSHVSYLGILARHYYRTSLAFPHDTAHLPRQAICIVHNCQPSIVFVSTPPPR
jgi:hypothetical protein